MRDEQSFSFVCNVAFKQYHSSTIGFMVGRQAVWQVLKIWAKLEILKACCRSNHLILRYVAMFSQGTALFQQLDAILMLFQANTSKMLFYKCEIVRSPMISY